MKKKKPTIPSIIKWVIALILVVMQVYPFFYVFTSSLSHWMISDSYRHMHSRQNGC